MSVGHGVAHVLNFLEGDTGLGAVPHDSAADWTGSALEICQLIHYSLRVTQICTHLDGLVRHHQELGVSRMHHGLVNAGSCTDVLLKGLDSPHLRWDDAIVALALHHHNSEQGSSESALAAQLLERTLHGLLLVVQHLYGVANLTDIEAVGSIDLQPGTLPR